MNVGIGIDGDAMDNFHINNWLGENCSNKRKQAVNSLV